jgi:GAF domain-containing protein
MRRRIGIFGASEETLALIPLLSANPGIEIVRVFDDDVDGVMSRLVHMEPGVAALLEQTLTSDAEAFAGDTSLAAVVDTAREGGFAERFPAAAERGVQVVTPLAARMLWGYGAGSTAPPPARPSEPGPPVAATADSAPPPAAPVTGHKEELLQALSEIVESYNLTIDTDELFTRMLEIAISVIGADGGSLMLLDEPSGELRVRVAVGVEPELWPKIRVALGEGIAGRVASEGRPLRLRGRADRQHFRIVRERLDVESALSVPLIHGGRVLGVLNLHHGSRPDAFSEDDLAFSEQLAHLDAQIIARAQEHEVLRAQAARYSAVREVREIMTSRTGLDERLSQLCAFVAERSGRGIASVYHYEPDEDALRLAATSLDAAAGGGGFRIALGQGIDGQVAQSRVPTFLRGSEGAVAYAALPLVAGDSLAGVLSIQAGSDAPQGRAAEEMLLEIAAAAAEELVHADRETRIAARANKVAAINEAGIRMISTSDLAEVLRLGTSEATLVLESDHAVVRLQDEETRRYVIRSYFGSAEGQLQEQLFRFGLRGAIPDGGAPVARRPGDRNHRGLRPHRAGPDLPGLLQRPGPEALHAFRDVPGAGDRQPTSAYRRRSCGRGPARGRWRSRWHGSTI